MSDYIKVGAESTFGDGAASLTGAIVTSVTEDIDRGMMIEETIDTSLPRHAAAGALKVNGTIECNLRPYQFITLLEAVMGDSSDEGTYTRLTLAEPTSVELQVGESIGSTSYQREYVGVGISSIDMAFEAKEFVKTTFNWIGKNYSDAAYSAPSYTTEDPVVFYNAAITLAGGATYNIKSLDMTIDRKLDEDQYVLGSFTLRRLAITGNTEISGSITFTEDEFNEFKRAIYGSTGATAVPATNDLGTAALVITCNDMSGDAAMVITAPIAVYSTASKNSSGKAEVEKTIDYQVLAGSTDFTVDIYTATPSTPVAAFTSSPTGLSVAFTDTTTNSPVYWAWDFGDDSGSFLQNPTHTYSTGGTYTVTLIVENLAGTDVYSTTVTVS